MLVLLGGGGWAAYRYGAQPTELTAVAPAAVTTPAAVGAVAPTRKARPVELPTVAIPSSHAAPIGTASPAVQPIIEIKPTEPRTARSVSASWFEGADGFGRAKQEQEYAGAPMLVYFRVDWCPYCQRMDQDIIGSSAVQRFLADVVKVRINPESSPADAALARTMGVHGYPSVFVVARPGASPEKIPSLSRKASEPLELSADKFISAAKGAGIRQAQNRVVDGFHKLERGDTAGARADLDRALALDPKNPDAYFWRGQADAKAGELGKAVGNFKRVLELDSDRKDALFALANLYQGNREHDEAIKYLTRVVRADPDHAHGAAFAQRGHSYKMKGDLDAAKADFAEACQRGTPSACAQAQP